MRNSAFRPAQLACAMPFRKVRIHVTLGPGQDFWTHNETKARLMWLEKPEKAITVGATAIVFGGLLIASGIYALSVLLPVG